MVGVKQIQDEFSHLPTASMRYSKRNRALVNKKRSDHKFNNIPFWLLKAAKARATKKGLDLDITVADIIVPEFCPVFGFKLEASNGKATDASPSLDRIDNTKGYIKGNVQVISNKANRLKGDASVRDIERLYHWIKGLNG